MAELNARSLDFSPKFQMNLCLAFAIALLVHAVVLAWRFSVTTPMRIEHSTLRVSLQEAFEPDIVEEVVVPVPEALEEPLPAEVPQEVTEQQTETEKAPPESSPAPSVSIETLVSDEEQKQARVSITEFSKWYKSDQKNNGIEDSATLQEFSNTFIDSVIEVEPDIKYEEGPLGPMGGGIYKIRKDGVTCDQLTMAPLTFDELQYGTSTIIDNCTQDEKMKIDIHRLNK